MNIFKELVLSIYSYKSYSKFLENKKRKVFAFGILLTLIYFAFSILMPFAKFVTVDGGISGLVEEYIPEFELKNGTLWAEDVFEYEYQDNYFYVDTDRSDSFYTDDEISGYLYGYSYSNVILMDSEKLIVKNDGAIQELYFSDFETDFRKADLMDFVPYVNAILAVTLVLLYLLMAAVFFFGVIFVALIGMIVASCMKYKLTFGQLYLLGIYSRALPLLLKSVLSLFSVGLPLLINFGISVVIVGLAIKHMKTEEPEELPIIEFTSKENS